MLIYDIDPKVEAFSTHISDALDFDVTLPQHQAHGTRCVEVTASTPPEHTYGADALITREPRLRIGVKTADCVPILVYAPDCPAVAAIHSGWKGTVAGIAPIVINQLAASFGADTALMKAVIGPCIHLGAFEVGDEVYNAFAEAGYAHHSQRLHRFGALGHVRWHIDLPSICREQLQKSGLSHIEVRPECTYANHTIFYSARRLGRSFDRQRILSCICIL